MTVHNNNMHYSEYIMYNTTETLVLGAKIITTLNIQYIYEQ